MVSLKFLLDTNICIYLMNQQPASVIQQFTECAVGEVGLSTVTWAELCCGMDIHHGQAEMKALLAPLVLKAFDEDAAAMFGRLSQQFPSRKSSFDRMIAAHAISLGVTLVTNNADDFELYKSAGLSLENWV